MTIKHTSTGLGLKVITSIWEEDHSVEGDLIPETDNTYDLGSSTKIYQDLYVDSIKKLTTIVADATATITLKDVSENSRIIIDQLGGTTFRLRPATNNTGQLGDSSFKWSSVNCTTLYADNVPLFFGKTFFFDIDGKAYNPGDTSYHAIDETQCKVANNYYKPSYARVIARVNADEAGISYLKITDNVADVAVVAWTGSGAQTVASSWTAYTDTTDRTMKAEYKAASATETITLYNVALEMR